MAGIPFVLSLASRVLAVPALHGATAGQRASRRDSVRRKSCTTILREKELRSGRQHRSRDALPKAAWFRPPPRLPPSGAISRGRVQAAIPRRIRSASGIAPPRIAAGQPRPGGGHAAWHGEGGTIAPPPPGAVDQGLRGTV